MLGRLDSCAAAGSAPTWLLNQAIAARARNPQPTGFIGYSPGEIRTWGHCIREPTASLGQSESNSQGVLSQSSGIIKQQDQAANQQPAPSISVQQAVQSRD